MARTGETDNGSRVKNRDEITRDRVAVDRPSFYRRPVCFFFLYIFITVNVTAVTTQRLRNFHPSCTQHRSDTKEAHGTPVYYNSVAKSR